MACTGLYSQAREAIASFFPKVFENSGAVTKRLCIGLQIRLARFDSGPRLQITAPSTLLPGLFCFTIASHARMVKLVDTSDLKSAATQQWSVPVRPRFRAPLE